MSSYKIVTSKPGKGDKYIKLYNNSNNGGISYCITGKPADGTCNVLCNCVGWACGRFNHIYNELTGAGGNTIKYPMFCCNAENFIEVAKNTYGLAVGSTPKPGAIMVWQKGSTLGGSDGAGHVAVVEKVISSNEVMTSESGYNSFAFKNRTRSNSNGNWGIGSPYRFRGFIYNPAVNDSVTPEDNTDSRMPSNVSRNTNVNQVEVKIDHLNVRTGHSTGNPSIGFASIGFYNYTETANEGGYTWYRIGNEAWIAFSSEWCTAYPATGGSALPTPVACNTATNQIEVLITSLRVRTSANTSATVIGFARPGYYNYTEIQSSNGYNWYKIGNNAWIANGDGWTKIHPAGGDDLRVGDVVMMDKGAPVYGHTYKYNNWVYNSKLYVRQISGSKVTISTQKTGAVTGNVDKKYLHKV